MSQFNKRDWLTLTDRPVASSACDSQTRNLDQGGRGCNEGVLFCLAKREAKRGRKSVSMSVEEAMGNPFLYIDPCL